MEKYKAFRIAGGIGILFLITGVFEWAFFVKSSLPCFFKNVTGLYCPTCGATRAVIHLVHGEILSAVRCNAYITLVSIPFLIWVIRIAIGLIFDKKEWYTVSVRFLVCFLILIGLFVIFGVVRNIPTPPFIWVNP